MIVMPLSFLFLYLFQTAGSGGQGQCVLFEYAKQPSCEDAAWLLLSIGIIHANRIDISVFSVAQSMYTSLRRRAFDHQEDKSEAIQSCYSALSHLHQHTA